ncbi:hypothetical protein EC957_008891 [Mortierella hygrophila]|uniref:F-box domain-containing protein n=1 Tax=Mortierella hygrophila TaxID=979708 RepID=A0A9P6EWK6_9FUNG|nr:hypothetical protein EC957_008891 [Mortierella hygrophila]
MSSPQPHALIEFFKVVELVSLLCSFLTTKQVFMLGQTNKFLREAAEPSLWRHVDLEADHRVEMLYTHYDPIYHGKHSDEYGGRILLSKIAGYSNINKTRSLKAGFAFMSYYLEGVRQYLDNDSTQLQQQHQKDIPPSWIPAHQIALFSTPLPIIQHLHSLDVSLLRVRRYPDTFFAGLNNAPLLVPQLFHFITLNAAHLTSLSLRHFQVSIADPTDLTSTDPTGTLPLRRTISRLSNLAHLAVDIISDGPFEPPFAIIPTVFFSCPTSLVSFSMTTTVCGENANAEGLWEEKPFTGLKYLKLPQHRTGYKLAQLNLILDQCSALEEWANVPSTLAPDQLGGRLQYPLTLLDLSTHPSRICKGETVMDIMNMIPKGKLKSLDFRLFEDTSPDKPDNLAPFFLSLLRHSASLVTISLADINWIQSKSVKHILTTCTALASLVLASSNTMRSCLTVEDAIAKPWTCTLLRELRLIIKLNRGCSNEYTMLETLYTQLGDLENLEILDLMSASSNRMASKPYTETTMTCMLALRNKTSNREGFLKCFVKLKNLRVLLGSFLLSNEEMEGMVGEAEKEWILDNWPRLETIEFISEQERRQGSVRWPLQIKLLKQERPNLQFCRSQTR